MPRRSPLPLLALLAFALIGAGCDPQPITVTVIGDSHSDIQRVPRYDWLQWAPPNWIVNEHARAGYTCKQAVLDAIEPPGELGGDVMVIFCGTNDAARTWDVNIVAGWIATAVTLGLGQGDPVVVVTPPPAYTDQTVPAAVRNANLIELRDAIYGLQATYGIEVADVWSAILASSDPLMLYADDGLHLGAGGQITAFTEINAAIQRARAAP